MPITIIAIDGRAGSGKSTLARRLSGSLKAQIISTDDFASFKNPLDWWPVLIEKVLEPIKQGKKTLSYERSQWWPEHKPEPVANKPVTPIIILEGVSTLRSEFRSYLTFTIWVETPREICLQRGLERDGQDKLAQWEKWFADEDKYIARDQPQEYADVIVSGTKGI